jgi:hypothetical protein
MPEGNVCARSMRVRDASYRPLIGPALLTGAGFTAYALAPRLAERLALDELPAQALHDLAGVWAWLALAWLGGRVCDLLLLRAGQMSQRSAPYPRLLADLLRVALFAAAAVAILLAVFQRQAAGLIATSSVVIAIIGFALRNTIADLFAGIALGIEHPYRIGDWIETNQGGGPSSVVTPTLASRGGLFRGYLRPWRSRRRAWDGRCVRRGSCRLRPPGR